MKIKYVAAIVVIIILIGLPIGSYLYLRSGYMYRLNALEELETKGKLDKGFFAYNASDTITLDELKAKTLILSPCKVDEALNSKLDVLEEQFNSAPTFKLLRLEGDEIIENRDYSNCYFIPQIYYDQFFLEHTFVLLDTSLDIRNYFNSDKASFTHMVEHLAIVLPREKEKKIEVKKD